MKFRLSERKHLPVLTLNNYAYAFPLWKYRYLKQLEKHGVDRLILNGEAIHCLDELYHGWYKPPFSLKGKTVLDVGACCGETAWYYSCLGAEKVICIEREADRVEILYENRKRTGLNWVILPEPFRIQHLSLPFDFAKIDVEGAERILLNCRDLKPCIVEVHGLELRQKFTEAGFRKVNKSDKSNCVIMTNFTEVV